MHYLFFKVPRDKIFIIKFLVESYENMMEISTIDKDEGKIQITIAPDFLKDCKDILKSLSEEFGMISLTNENPKLSQGSY